MPAASFKTKLHLAIALALMCACDQGVLPEQREVVWFTAIETDVLKTRPYVDQPTTLTTAQLNQLEPIVNDFLRNHERLFQDREVTRQIWRIEDVFMAFGRFHELIPLYREDVEERGAESFVAPQLAWAYIRLGQRDLARTLLDDLLGARSDDPLVHFLDGAFWIQSEPRGEDAVRNAVAAWKRTVELDPDFRGPEGLDAPTLRQEIERFERQTGPVTTASPVEVAVRRASNTVTVASIAAQPAAPAALDTPAAPAAPDSVEQRFELDEQLRLLIARAEMQLASGDEASAVQLFEQAKALQPNNFAAEFGHQRARWAETSARNDVAAKMRELAKRDDLTPRERYDLGIFLWSKMERLDLARPLWETIAADDPALAERVGIGALLERTR